MGNLQAASLVFRRLSLLIVLAYVIADAISSGVDAAITGTLDQSTVVGSTFISMGVTAFYLKAHDDPCGLELSELYHPRPFWKYLGAFFSGLPSGSA